MTDLTAKRAIANRHLKCSLCAHIVEPGELFWRVRQGTNSDSDTLWLCVGHIPMNTKQMIVDSSDGLSSITNVRSDAVDARASIIPRLLEDPKSIFRLTPDEFEELVLDRLLAMNLQAFRMGPANRRDGGVDIVFWTTGLLPMLGAVQVKHHRTTNAKVTPSDVREFAGVMEQHHFNIGIIVTNTSFTEDAKHQAQSGASPILLRDGAVLERWVVDDFTIETLGFIIRNLEFCKGVVVDLPKFL